MATQQILRTNVRVCSTRGGKSQVPTLQQQRFKEAAHKCSAALADPALAAYFRARALPGRTAYTTAMAHYLATGTLNNLKLTGP